jgi:PKD repeat protein
MGMSVFGIVFVRGRSLFAAVCALMVTASLFVAGTYPRAAWADSAPPSGTPATVAADKLPTWQINGVAWAQVVVGDVVYVTGSFTSARPPGSRAGTNEVPRQNLLAYNITTGNLITTFNHPLNAQGLAIAASPDGSKVYVGGQFTTVDGLNHYRIAAFDTATGALISTFRAVTDTTVRALAATSSTLYAGGDFNASGSVARSRLAAFDATTGAVTTWNPGADSGVTALTLSPDRNRLVVGGRFTTLGGASRYGLGAVDLLTGAATSWTSNPVVKDAGVNAAITSLSSDSTNTYGTGYVFGPGGNFEGRFAINATGNIVWMNDCHGDTYSAYPIGSVLYSVGHAHFCTNMGAFPETSPRSYHHALAETTYATGILKKNIQNGYTNFGGQPDSTQLNWYPNMDTGSYTGQGQAAWSVTGNANYVALGGEFPTINNSAQQGLTRFAIASLSTNKIGPAASTALTPTATRSGSTVNLSWGTTYDLDNGVLTYRVYRDGSTISIGSKTVDTRFWTVPAPTQTFTDTSPPSGTHTYVIKASDPFGNTVSGAASNAVTITGGNTAPIASYTNSCTQLACTFNASASSDPDGSVVGYSWAFGDGAVGTGASVQHTYSVNGTYSVTLTVTDNGGATGEQTKSISVSSVVVQPGVFAADAFNRTVPSGGLGAADIGGNWTAISGSAAQSVTPGAGKLTPPAAGATTIAVLSSTSQPGAVVSATVSFDKIADGGGTYFSMAGRRIDSTHEYRANVHVLNSGKVNVYITKLDGSATDVAIGTQVQLVSAVAAGQKLSVKFSVITSAGTTTLGLKAWPTGSTEPASWQTTGTDSSAALQGSGSVGVRAYLSASTTSAPVVVSLSSFEAAQP